MTIDAIVPVPAMVTSMQAYFANLTVTAPNQPAPSNPFAVLLAAATSPVGPSTPAPGSDSNNPALGGLSPNFVSGAGLGSSGSTAVMSTAMTAGASPSGLAIVGKAGNELGIPYTWGGSTPASGFDCSGLVQYVFGQLGISMPRTAAQQEQMGTPVASLSQAQPGDLLFFEPGQNGAPPGQAGHVAIYIGNGQMIAAPETGQDVQVQSVPGTPLAIRHINLDVPSAGSSSGTSAGTQVAPAASGSTQIGNVSVPNQFSGLIRQASASTGTPAPIIAAILYNESRFNPSAVSSAGAEGIAQIMPATAAANGINPFDPSSAINGAANLLAQYHAAFGSWSDAIAAYAAGGAAVQGSGGIPQDGTTPGYVSTTLSLAGMASGS